MGLFQGLPHCALAVGRATSSDPGQLLRHWSGASHPCTTTLGSSFATLTCGCVPSSWSVCVGGVTHPSGPQAARRNYDPAKPWITVFAMAVADKEWWNENLHRPASRQSRKQPRKSQEPSRSVFSCKGRQFCDDLPPRRLRSASECPDLHACKVCKGLDHGMQIDSSPGSCTPPPATWDRPKGSRRSRISGSDINLPLARLQRLVAPLYSCADRRPRKW